MGKNRSFFFFVLTGWVQRLFQNRSLESKSVASLQKVHERRERRIDGIATGQCRKSPLLQQRKFWPTPSTAKAKTFSEEEASRRLELSTRPQWCQCLEEFAHKAAQNSTIKAAVTRAVKAVDTTEFPWWRQSIPSQKEETYARGRYELPRSLVQVFEEEAENCWPVALIAQPADGLAPAEADLVWPNRRRRQTGS